MPHDNQDQHRIPTGPNGEHRISAARASQGSSQKDLSNVGDNNGHCGQRRRRVYHPPDSLPVVSHPNCLVFVDTDRLIAELLNRHDSVVILRYRENNDETYDLNMSWTPNLSTPDDIVSMITATLESFGLIGEAS